MRSRAEIVQELLDKKLITAEDAVVLLMNSSEKEYVYVPVYPAAPYNPSPWQSPFIVTCQENGYAVAAANVKVNFIK